MSWSKRVAWMILFLAVYLPWEYIENQSWLGVGIERFKKRKGDYRVFDSIGGWYVISKGDLYFVQLDEVYWVSASHKVVGRRLWVKGGQDGYEIPYYSGSKQREHGGWDSRFNRERSESLTFFDRKGIKIEFSANEIKPWR